MNVTTNEQLLEKIEELENRIEELEGKQETLQQDFSVEFKGLEQFAGSFKFMGLGMLGIFVVTTVLIVSITLLNKIKDKNNSDK